MVRGTLAVDLDEDGQVHEVFPVPLVEGGQQLQTIAGYRREREGRRGEEREGEGRRRGREGRTGEERRGEEEDRRGGEGDGRRENEPVYRAL